MFQNQNNQNVANLSQSRYLLSNSYLITQLIEKDQKHHFQNNTEANQQLSIKFFFVLNNNIINTLKVLNISNLCYKIYLFFALLMILTVNVKAQTVVMTGPSSRTSAPPVSASAVNVILAPTENISLKTGSASTSSDIRYQWYKQDSTGTKYLVQDSNDPTLKETVSGYGYYIYQLLTSNSNQCTSEISDPFKVYVLPPINASVAASSGTVCANNSSTSTLTASVSNNSFSYLYQWALNGNNISGATSAAYTTPANINSNSTYTVKVAYALKNSVTGTATQTVNVIAVPGKPSISVGQ